MANRRHAVVGCLVLLALVGLFLLATALSPCGSDMAPACATERGE